MVMNEKMNAGSNACGNARLDAAADAWRNALYIVLGAACAVLARASAFAVYGAQHGTRAMAESLLWQYGGCLLIGVALAVALRVGRAQAGGPARFLCLLVLASVAASWPASILFQSSGAGLVLRFDPPTYSDTLVNTLLWGGLFGWLAVLDQRRRAARLLFAGVMARRAALARQVAQAQLAAERALVDPGQVAGVLREVQALYGHAPAQAAATLDQLVAHLRKAKRGSAR